MGAEFSSKLAKDVLDVFFTGTTSANFDSDSSGDPGLFVALTASQTAVDGSVSTEISGSGYARVAVTFAASGVTETTADGKAVALNTNLVEFTGFTGQISGVNGFAICASDVEAAADALCYGTITSVTIDSGDTVSFAINAISISLD